MANARNEADRRAPDDLGVDVDFEVTRTAGGGIALPLARDEDIPAYTVWYMNLLGQDHEDDGVAS